MSAGRTATILCIDDNVTALSIRKAVLERTGYSVMTATDAEGAMQVFGSSAIDLVISDHLLHGATGTELAAEMKQLKPAIPIVIISGVAETPRGMEHADLFIGKCEPPPVWLEKIANVLAASRGQLLGQRGDGAC